MLPGDGGVPVVVVSTVAVVGVSITVVGVVEGSGKLRGMYMQQP